MKYWRLEADFDFVSLDGLLLLCTREDDGKNEFVYDLRAMDRGEQKMWKYEKILGDNPK